MKTIIASAYIYKVMCISYLLEDGSIIIPCIGSKYFTLDELEKHIEINNVAEDIKKIVDECFSESYIHFAKLIENENFKRNLGM